MSEYTLLLVDDEESVLRALRRLFREDGYRIFTATDADQALAVMAAEPVQLVISDFRMPGRDGVQLLKEIKVRWPETIRIMLTGYTDIDSIMAAVNEGAVYKFITKPWNDEDLRLTVRLAREQYSLRRENRELKMLAERQAAKLDKGRNRLGEDHGGAGRSAAAGRGACSRTTDGGPPGAAGG
ncbi:response regulator [Desulfurivibrio alkaliphilus]|uniref:response regulator n=1 Tax=Desulfurivibrio alkaliphilus TaxID=427923 RepID=UPI0001B3EA0F|nr:response regulator [Desulfurivibrio alkaliphilus]